MRRKDPADHAGKQGVADTPRGSATIAQCSGASPWVRNCAPKMSVHSSGVCHEGRLPISSGCTWTGECTASAGYYTSNFIISDTNTRYF